MSINHSAGAINRCYELHEKRASGMPYIVNLSDIRDLNRGEKDVPLLGGGGKCNRNPESCGRLIKGNKRCANVVELKFPCPNVERGG